VQEQALSGTGTAPGPLARGAHLARRFFGFLLARPLSPREQSEVAGLLETRLAALFFSQQTGDQRHALDVAHRVLAVRPGERAIAVAALLHDVGKRRCGLGAVRRAAATLAAALHLPVGERMRRYLDHGPLGAADLEAAGADPLTVAFAREHPAGPPPGFDRADWDVLLAADHT
jgi:hypothetical protein